MAYFANRLDITAGLMVDQRIPRALPPHLSCLLRQTKRTGVRLLPPHMHAAGTGISIMSFTGSE